jgi:hypothetical protein
MLNKNNSYSKVFCQFRSETKQYQNAIQHVPKGIPEPSEIPRTTQDLINTYVMSVWRSRMCAVLLKGVRYSEGPCQRSLPKGAGKMWPVSVRWDILQQSEYTKER